MLSTRKGKKARQDLFTGIQLSCYKSRLERQVTHLSKHQKEFSFYLLGLLSTCSVLFFPVYVFADTIVSSAPIEVNTTWTKEGSPYVALSGVTTPVSEGVTLTIEPGVVVKFSNNSGLVVFGRLVAEGTLEEPIYFTSLYDDSVGGDTDGADNLIEPSVFDWWGISLVGGDASHLISHVTMRFAYKGLFLDQTRASFEEFNLSSLNKGVLIQNSDVTFRNSVLHDIKRDGIIVNGGTFSASNIEVDGVFGGDGISLLGAGSATLDRVRVFNSKGYAALGLYGASAEISNSLFSGGSGRGVQAYKLGPDMATLILRDTIVENYIYEGVGVYSSNAEISNISVSNSGIGLGIYNRGFTSVIDSRMFGNILGVKVFHGRMSMERVEIRDNEFGINTYWGFWKDMQVVLSNSSITGNSVYGYDAHTDSFIDARGNWWGDASGPYHEISNPDGKGDTVLGSVVDFSDWLTSDPFVSVPTCCSAVAFIPGLEASRLYREGFLLEDKLWEPNNNNDVRQLFLSPETGESLDSGIYTRDVIDEPLGFSLIGNIYKGFLSFMDGLVKDGAIADFETLPYDWRKDVRDVVQGDIALADGVSYRMIDRIEELALGSETGKVTVITHSNGGLVAKELLDELARLGKAELVDRVIMVAAPQTGTPDAVLQLLHGTKFFLGLPSKEITRELGESMKSAYALLPSRAYFSGLSALLENPIIQFSTTTEVTRAFRDIYGQSISDYDSLRAFLLGENGARSEPSAWDVLTPNVLKSGFLVNAEELHSVQDVWTPPLGVEVIEIVGWGLDTPYGIYYDKTKKKVCNENLSVCEYRDVLDPRPILNSEGDRTVVYSSADVLGGERYYVDIKEYNEDRLFNREHKNLLEISPLQELLSLFIQQGDTTALPQFISVTKPTDTSDRRFRIGVHSPVELHLYDEFGRHTGPVPNPNPDSDFELYEEQIPNSYYFTLGEGQYAGVGSAQVTAVLKGTSLGTFSFDLEEVMGGQTASKVVFEDIPVTITTTATLSLDAENPLLLLDIDGDGSPDVELTSGGLTAEELIGIIKGLVKTLELPRGREELLLNRLDRLEEDLTKEYQREHVEKLKTALAFKQVIKFISLYEERKWLTKDEALELITMLENIRSTVVK